MENLRAKILSSLKLKRRMGDMQASGKLKSLVWSTFFDHTANEADADFVAHLLGPEERTLIAKAMQTSDAFRAMHNNTVCSKAPLEKAVNQHHRL